MSIPHEALAAEMLDGVLLPGGWKVIRRLAPSSTGGNFGVPYLVENESRPGKHAFLKALNLRRAAAEQDFARAVQQYVTAFNFERDTLSICVDRGLRRVARLLDSGEYRIPGAVYPICFIIFELADRGDVRKHLDIYTDFNLAWTLRTLHQVTVAMSQLHTYGIAHQDLKPSNILLFESFGVKIGDLGCADTANRPSESPRGCWPIAGDPGYAPPELHYREINHDWKVRRVGCDLYLLGNLFVFFFTKIPSITALWTRHLDDSHKPGSWASDYRTVLPYVRDAFEKGLQEFSEAVPERVRAPITRIVRYLCEPDPAASGASKRAQGQSVRASSNRQ